MDSRIPDIKPMGMESWVMPEQAAREPKAIPPVPESEGGSFNKTDSDSANKQSNSPAVISRDQAHDLVKNAQGYLNDLNVGVTFEIHDKTGELIVKVVNRETNQVIRQIPPEALVKLHDNLKDLVGVIFNGKA
jgi:flagellar protein FlaG